jgi:GrpB-like predicted nucleotidyltransferase (UPF0157 family)
MILAGLLSSRKRPLGCVARSHPEEARRYRELKLSLADQYRANREAYTEAKAAFINSVMEKAQRA